MKRFIRIQSVAKGRAAPLQGAKFKFFIAQTKEKSSIKLGLYLGESIINHLMLRPESKICITFAIKNNFKIKIRRCKPEEYGYKLDYLKVKKEDVLGLSFCWVTCKIPLKWTLLPLRKGKHKLIKDCVIIDLQCNAD